MLASGSGVAASTKHDRPFATWPEQFSQGWAGVGVAKQVDDGMHGGELLTPFALRPDLASHCDRHGAPLGACDYALTQHDICMYPMIPERRMAHKQLRCEYLFPYRDLT